ncbi:MAG TPA: YggS family pyridoxal phosphate-dependent enzyme [Acidobacteriaceae bacterium]|nr:YggS family pyridoxal phosphate-dependent enzyme [Acidobacteriaceae bacterium]
MPLLPAYQYAPPATIILVTFADRLALIEDRIAAACRRTGRSRSDVRLMAVSKIHPAEAIVEAVSAGVTLFGENRVQEFESKRARLAELHVSAEVHLIAHLQSNKAAKAAALFDAIDSVDSLRLAERLNEAASKAAKTLPILLELKLSDEVTKTGLDPHSADLRVLLDRLSALPNVVLRGLMTIAPFDDNPETARACFRRLRMLRESLARDYPALDLRELSMGMSGDFEVAIEEESTLIRIGTALFGARPKPAPHPQTPPAP